MWRGYIKQCWPDSLKAGAANICAREGVIDSALVTADTVIIWLSDVSSHQDRLWDGWRSRIDGKLIGDTIRGKVWSGMRSTIPNSTDITLSR